MKANYLLTCIAAVNLFWSGGFSAPASDDGSSQQADEWVRASAVQLQVMPFQQSGTTSCGEAAVTMAYDYAYPHAAVGEQTVISYAKAEGLFTPRRVPFTSPANMVTIADHFAGPVVSGNVASAEDGLALLWQQLRAGRPVVIDITTRLDKPNSGAHFVVVTGLSADPLTAKIRVRYNNPLVGETNSADWDGNEGIWKAWQNNGDPGGSGWWLVMPPAASSHGF